MVSWRTLTPQRPQLSIFIKVLSSSPTLHRPKGSWRKRQSSCPLTSHHDRQFQEVEQWTGTARRDWETDLSGHFGQVIWKTPALPLNCCLNFSAPNKVLMVARRMWAAMWCEAGQVVFPLLTPATEVQQQTEVHCYPALGKGLRNPLFPEPSVFALSHHFFDSKILPNSTVITQ